MAWGTGLKPYNGYAGTLRTAAQAWLNKQWRSGTLVRPAMCVACGQPELPIDAHAEDYSQPFTAGKTDQFHLCYSCHMAVHCRFRNPVAWDGYRAMVALGGRFPAMGRNFPKFMQAFTGTVPAEIVQGPPPARLVLDEIDAWLLTNTGKGWR